MYRLEHIKNLVQAMVILGTSWKLTWMSKLRRKRFLKEVGCCFFYLISLDILRDWKFCWRHGLALITMATLNSTKYEVRFFTELKSWGKSLSMVSLLGIRFTHSCWPIISQKQFIVTKRPSSCQFSLLFQCFPVF